MNRNSRFLRHEFFKTLIPVMFSVLAGTVNTLIDSVFIAQKLGSQGLAAINMCGPLYQIICTLGSLLAGGASILSAQEEGKNTQEKGYRFYHTAMLQCILAGAVLGVIGILFCRPVSAFLSQYGDLERYVYDYCLVTFIGLIPIALAYIPLYYLQLEGKMKQIMTMMVLVIFTDLFLDWFFMFVLDLRVFGAAAASILSMLISCIYGIAELEKADPGYRLSIKQAHINQMKPIIKYGSPVAIGNLFDAVKLLLLNTIIFRAGGSIAIAIWAVLNAFSELSLSIVGGIPQAAQPMIGVFYSSRENSGIRILMKIQIQTGICLIGIFTAALLTFHKGIETLFNLTGSIFIPLLCLGIFMIFEMLCSIWGSFFNVTDQITLSNILMGARTFFFPVAAAYLLMRTGGYTWLFLPLGSALSVILLFILTEKKVRESRNSNHVLSRGLLLDDYLEREGLVLDFSIEPSDENICDASDKIKEFCSSTQMDEKLTNRLGLAIEELLVVMRQDNPKMVSVDLRAFALEETTGIRIRSAGGRYNPFEQSELEEDDFYMGIMMLKRMANEITYSYTLGMNTICLNFGERKKA